MNTNSDSDAHAADSRKRNKRALLYSLIASVGLGAMLGIAIVLRGEWSWFEIRTLLTTLIIAVASLCGLACDLSRLPRGSNWLPNAGTALTLLATCLLLVGVWYEPNSEGYWKTTVCVIIAALSMVHISLLSIARLADRFRWVYFIGSQVILGLGALAAIMLIWELDDEGMFRFLLVLSILDAAFTLAIPLLHRISRTDDRSASLTTPLDERNLLAIDQEIAALRKQIEQLERLKQEIGRGEA